MNPTERRIKHILIDMDWTQAKLARRLGVSRSMVSLLIKQKGVSASLQKSMAKLLKVDYHELWGTVF